MRRWLWIAVPMLAMTYGVLALAAQQKDAGSSQETGKQKNPKNSGATDMNQSVDPSQYVGVETCRSCHEEVAAGYDKSPHSKMSAKHEGPQWQGCEACHGPGKAHAESGDADKIIRPGALSRVESSKRCMGCHEFAQEPANFLRSQHFKNNVGCLDCHTIHEPRVEARLLKAAMPQLCYSCHLGVKTDSRPFHRGVAQGRDACTDCHNPHDGHSGSDQKRPKT